jgi:hypothetical protein
MHSNLNLEDKTTSKTSSSTNTATHDFYDPTASISMMTAGENTHVRVELSIRLPPTILGFEPLFVPPRETAPKVSEFKPPTVPPSLVTSLAAFEATSLVSLFLYTQPLPYATLNPEGLLIPELGALHPIEEVSEPIDRPGAFGY